MKNKFFWLQVKDLEFNSHSKRFINEILREMIKDDYFYTDIMNILKLLLKNLT